MNEHLKTSLVVAALLSVAPAQGTAQNLGAAALVSTDLHSQVETSDNEPWIGWPILAGLGLGTAGWFAGALLALEIEEDCGDSFCFFDEVIFLGAATGTTGLALGVHLGNGRRGDFLLDLGTAGAIWGVGYLVFISSRDRNLAGPLAFGVPIAQLAITTVVERARGRAKQRQRAELLITPMRGRGVGVGAKLTF